MERQGDPPRLVPSLIFIALVVAAVGSLGAPLITSVARTYHVSLASGLTALMTGVARSHLDASRAPAVIALPALMRLGPCCSPRA